MNIFELLGGAIVINLVGFLVAFWRKSDKLTDFSYGTTFFVLTMAAFLTNDYSFTNYLALALVCLWAARIASFLLIRIIKVKKDKRFDGVRESFWKFGQFWILQGITAWIILLPTIFLLNAAPSKVVGWSVAGLVIATFGLIIETFADSQKFSFTQDPKNAGRFINVGLWKFSRHPNYFGEITMWLGMYIFAFAYLTSTQKIVGLASPLYIAYLLIFVTGLPKLEKYANQKWGKDKDYQTYKQKTPVLIPALRQK